MEEPNSLDPNTVYLLIGGITMLVSALGALLNQLFSAWMQRKQAKTQEKTDDRHFILEEKKTDVDTENQKITTSSAALDTAFRLLNDCMTSRSQLQAEIRTLTLNGTKKDSRIYKVVSDLSDLVEDLAKPDGCPTDVIQGHLLQIITILKENGNGANGHV